MGNTMTNVQYLLPAEVASQPCQEDQDVSEVVARGNVETSQPIRRILVPTNFSPCSAEALDRAILMARQWNAAITLLHVIDINPPTGSSHCGTADELMRQLCINGISELARLKESLVPSEVPIQTLLVEGLPCEEIVENSSGFDLLVINESQPKSAWNLFSRHSAQRVIELPKCPVQVVH